MKILFTINDAKFLLSHRFNIVKALRDLGAEVHLAAPTDESIKIFTEAGIVHHEWQMSRKGLNPWPEVQSLWQLIQIYRRVKPELIHNVTIKPIIYGGIAARLTGVPAVVNAVSGLGFVYTNAGFKKSLLRFLTNKGYQFAARHKNNAMIFQNRDDQALFSKNKITRKSLSKVIHGSGVCMQQFAPLPFPETEIPVVVLASRLLRDKGVVEFVEAARSLKNKINARFVLVGDVDTGNRASLTEALVQSWVAAGIVEWWGFQKDIKKVFSESHIVCLPSYREGSPRVLIEAAACARPILTTDVPGCRDLVRDDENGVIVPAKNVEALREGLMRLLNKNNLAEMGLKSRALVEKLYSQQTVVQETLAIYCELLAVENIVLDGLSK